MFGALATVLGLSVRFFAQGISIEAPYSLIKALISTRDVTLMRTSDPGINRVAQSKNKPPVIGKVDSILLVPLADDRALMGASHNVFVGKVISQIGVRQQVLSPGVSIPISQFAVEPISNIKGNLQGIVIVEQLGGYQNGVLVVGDAGDAFGPINGSGFGYLMQPGSTYLLATRYESPGVYYLWDFPTASKLINQNSSLSDARLQSLAAADARVVQLERAYPNEILDAEDVANHNTLNSYLSTHAPPPALPAPAPTSTATSSSIAATPTSTAIFISSSTNPTIASSTASSTNSSNMTDSSSSAATATSSPY